MTEQHLGFVGLGRMGAPMTLRLLEAGHTVHVYDTNPQAVAIAVQRGAKPAKSAAEVANAADIVFASLPTPDVVRDVVLGRDGLTSGTRLFLAAALAKDGRITLVDSPVSGGVTGAKKGTLALMVSCPRALFDQLDPLLAHFGKRFFVGEKPGLGQTLKLVNNLLAAAALAITSEGMVMGVKAGLDPKVMLDVINVSSGRNSATQDKFPRAVLPRTFDFGFTTGLSHKDVRLCTDEAEAMNVPMVVGAAVRQFLAMTSAAYGPGSDFTSMVKLVEGWAGVDVDGRSSDGA